MTRQGELILLGVLVIILGVAALRTGGKAPRGCAATGKCHGATRVSGAASVGFHLRHSRLDAESWTGLRRKHSARRAATWREPGDDVERGLVAVPLRRILAGRNLLLHPDAQETKQSCSASTCPAPGTTGWSSASMGFLWFGSIILYSISTVKLGDLGTSIGWPLFLASIVVASTSFGVLTGEWKRTGTRPIRFMILGVVFWCWRSQCSAMRGKHKPGTACSSIKVLRTQDEA